MPIALTITQGGLDALVDAQNGDTDPIQVVEIGLTQANFVVAPTLTGLPGEFKRIDSVAGQSVSETIIHMTAQDATTDVYDLRGIGLYLADGTLFAVYGQATPIFRKVTVSTFLLAFDISFANDVGASIEFGDALFLYPPASETVKGVAELATQAEVNAGVDALRIVTPAKLAVRLQALQTALTNLITTVGTDLDAAELLIGQLLARTISGGGLVTGGGNLSANRTLTVPAASAADVAAGTAFDRAVTPFALSGLGRYMSNTGFALIPGCGNLMLQWGRFTAAANGITPVTFHTTFPSACYSVVVDGTAGSGVDSQDNFPGIVASSIGASGFNVFSADDTADGCCYIAIGA